jgi:predicted nuclease of predicted toxin-antitoxin system
MELAAQENRILSTEDKDFGRIALASEPPTVGVILIRFPASARNALPDSARSLVRELGSRIEGAFIVLRPGTARIRSRREQQ